MNESISNRINRLRSAEQINLQKEELRGRLITELRMQGSVSLDDVVELAEFGNRGLPTHRNSAELIKKFIKVMNENGIVPNPSVITKELATGLRGRLFGVVKTETEVYPGVWPVHCGNTGAELEQEFSTCITADGRAADLNLAAREASHPESYVRRWIADTMVRYGQEWPYTE